MSVISFPQSVGIHLKCNLVAIEVTVYRRTSQQSQLVLFSLKSSMVNSIGTTQPSSPRYSTSCCFCSLNSCCRFVTLVSVSCIFFLSRSSILCVLWSFSFRICCSSLFFREVLGSADFAVLVPYWTSSSLLPLRPGVSVCFLP